MVTAVVQSNRYLIYMSGYAGSDKFAEQFATLAGMMNSLRILTDELPTDEGTGDSEAGGGETAVTEWATSSSEFFTIDYPANWVGEPFGPFAAWASSEEMAAAVATLFNSDVALAVTNGASALVLVGSYEDFQLPAGTDPITALTDLAAQFTAETGLSTTTVQAIQEVELNGSPAGYTVVSTELANGQPIKIVMGMVLGETQAARFAGYVLGDDDSAISLLTEMFMTFEFPTAQ